MAFRLQEILLSVLLLSFLCSTLEVKGGSVADDAAGWEPVLSPASEAPWRPSDAAIFGTFRSCANCRCCTSVGPRVCRDMYCCKEIVCGNDGCTPPTVVYCGCDPKTCNKLPPKERN